MVSYRPEPCSPIGRRIDSEMGVGRNWSADSAESLSKVARKRWDSTCAASTSMLSGRRNSSRPDACRGGMVAEGVIARASWLGAQGKKHRREHKLSQMCRVAIMFALLSPRDAGRV